MKNLTRHTGRLNIIERLPQSANGNARFLLEVDGWTCRTAVDSSIANDVKNFDGKRVDAIIGTHYGMATLFQADLSTVST
tara:strand:+ start:243 stop:482 length:240 start_codon:yes stop_codon:yes gene_type:complete